MAELSKARVNFIVIIPYLGSFATAYAHTPAVLPDHPLVSFFFAATVGFACLWTTSFCLAGYLRFRGPRTKGEERMLRDLTFFVMLVVIGFLAPFLEAVAELRDHDTSQELAAEAERLRGWIRYLRRAI
jgi:hypothetical protein